MNGEHLQTRSTLPTPCNAPPLAPTSGALHTCAKVGLAGVTRGSTTGPKRFFPQLFLVVWVLKQALKRAILGKGVQKRVKTHFSKNNPRSFGILKSLVLGYFQLSLNHFCPPPPQTLQNEWDRGCFTRSVRGIFGLVGGFCSGLNLSSVLTQPLLLVFVMFPPPLAPSQHSVLISRGHAWVKKWPKNIFPEIVLGPLGALKQVV